MAGFRHEALIYQGEDEFAAGVVPFLSEGVSAGEPTLVIVGPDRIARLRAELDGEAEAVSFVDMSAIGRNPGRLIPAWRDFVGPHLAGGQAVRGVGEPVWAGRTAAELEECRRHETLLNLAFGGGPAWRLLCPYDAGALEDEALEVAHHSHPVVVEGDRSLSSAAYAEPGASRDALHGSLPQPPPDAAELAFGPQDLGALRAVVTREGERCGLACGRGCDLVLAVSEIATNSVRHAGGKGTLRIWCEDGAVVCEVRDTGRIEEPLVGRARPGSDDSSGYGLWLANQLCDLLQIRSDAAGTVVRARMRVRMSQDDPCATRAA